MLTTEEKELWDKTMSGSSLPFVPAEKSQKNILGNITKNIHVPSTIDLHGYTVQQAYLKTKSHLENCFSSNKKSTTIITGRSGQIIQEFTQWLDKSLIIRKYQLLPNKGSWKIWLKKKDII